MGEQDIKQDGQTGQGQDTSGQAPASPQASQKQPQAVQAKPERPVFPSNSLLTEASHRTTIQFQFQFDTCKTGSTIQLRVKGVLIGDCVCDADGFWYFWPDKFRPGAWSQELLLALSAFLANLNQPHQDQISRYFSPWRRAVRTVQGWLTGTHSE